MTNPRYLRPKYLKSRYPNPTLSDHPTNPLQAELHLFCTLDELKRGWVSKKRADEIASQWRLWKFGR